MHPLAFLASIGLLVCLSGCGSRPVRADELSSDFHALASFSAETELFIDYLQNGKATGPYAREHSAYLAEEVREAQRDLAETTASSDLEKALTECRRLQSLLLNEQERLPASLADPHALDAIRQSVEDIRVAAGRSRGSL
jgi:hypothetical protein